MFRRNRHLQGAYSKITLKRISGSSFTLHIVVSSADFVQRVQNFKLFYLCRDTIISYFD